MATAATTTVHDLPEHILERILVCLGPSPGLVLAAAACRGWCRIVADTGFLARLRSAHPHGTRLGHYHCNRFFFGRLNPAVFVPSSPAAAIVVRHRRRLNLDFLPGGGGESWELVDSRGSLLLLAKLALERYSWERLRLLVYEPLTGRHQMFLGPGPSGGLASDFVDAFLVDGGTDNNCRIGKSSFKVLAVANGYKPRVFSSVNGGLLLVRTSANRNTERSLNSRKFVGRANGSIYWGINGRPAVLALDEATMYFSIIELPDNMWGAYNEGKRASRIIGGEDGALRIVRLISNELKVFVRRRHPANDDEWVLEKHLGLPEEGTMIIATANSKYVILAPQIPAHTWSLFSVELDTMRVEREHVRNKYNGEVYPSELPWPPVFPYITSH